MFTLHRAPSFNDTASLQSPHSNVSLCPQTTSSVSLLLQGNPLPSFILYSPVSNWMLILARSAWSFPNQSHFLRQRLSWSFTPTIGTSHHYSSSPAVVLPEAMCQSPVAWLCVCGSVTAATVMGRGARREMVPPINWFLGEQTSFKGSNFVQRRNVPLKV